ncbi:MAG: FAD-dependent oxidoreductase [Deltaproteobacteria bacterium]|nr:FAD-dependent oxidoreductase [Deltaproteobacteria bacterium]
MATSARTVIVGGGLAGLSCARALGSDFLLLEAEDRVGGLCRTDVVDGFHFDWTGHWFHARTPEVKALIQERWLKDNLLTVERKASIFSEGVWTKFPYQHHLYGLPAQTIAECIEGFVEATLGESGKALRERPLEHAGEFIQRHLGKGFAEKFLIPYNEKLFTIPVTELSPEWGGRFIPRPGLSEVLRGALGLTQAGAGYNASFWYPREGGIESLVRALAADVAALPGEVRLKTRVQSISLSARRLTLTNGEVIPYEHLVLTAPLSSVAKAISDAPPHVREAGAKLRAISTSVVEIGADDVGGERFHWAYFPERRFPFYRIGSPSEVNPRLAPKGTRSFALEFSHQGPADTQRMIAQSLDALSELRLIDKSKVRLARARTIPTAYVLFDRAHEASRRTVIEHLTRSKVQLAGRYGRWEYSSMEDALLSGLECARTLLQAAPTYESLPAIGAAPDTTQTAIPIAKQGT